MQAHAAPTLRQPLVTLRPLLVALALLLGAAAPRAGTPLLVYDFTLEQTPVENVELVRALGFQGLVTRVQTPADLVTLDTYARYVATLDDFRLIPYVSFDFSKPVGADVWRQALPVLAGLGAPLWVVVKQAPDMDAVRELLAQMARTSRAFGVRTVLYPHWNTDIETAAEAAALIADVGHPNLGSSLHTCHEIRGGNQDDLPAVVAAHAAQSTLVAIAGADDDAYVGPPGPFVSWSDVIKPLDEGDFSLLPFLQALHDAGYDGPVILQTFGITDDPIHLRRSIGAYAGYQAQVVD